MREPLEILEAIRAEEPITRQEVEAWIRYSARPRCQGPLCLSDDETAEWWTRLQGPRGLSPEEAAKVVLEPYETIWHALLLRQDLIDKVQPYVPLDVLMGRGPDRAEDRIQKVLIAAIGCGQDLAPSVAALPQDGMLYFYPCPRCGRAQNVTTMVARVEG